MKYGTSLAMMVVCLGSSMIITIFKIEHSLLLIANMFLILTVYPFCKENDKNSKTQSRIGTKSGNINRKNMKKV